MHGFTRSALALILGAASMAGAWAAPAGDPTLLGACAEVPDATVERARCLGELAAQKRDAMLCRETHLRGRKGYAGPLFESCFAAFARGTGDPELCSPLAALVDSSAKSICLANMPGRKALRPSAPETDCVRHTWPG